MMSEVDEEIAVFQYAEGPAPAIPAWPGFVEAEGAVASQSHAEECAPAGQSGAPDEQQEENARRSFESGRERGIQEGRQAEREAQAAARISAEQCRARQLAELVHGFAEERDRYLRAVEREVVALALAIAARVLRHEAQMDPLFLTGAVRVALGQLSGSTEVRLIVPQSDLDLWHETIAHIPNLPLRPTVLAGDGMHTGDCKVETSVGSVDLGVRAQLGEIERNLLDDAAPSSQSVLPANPGHTRHEA